MAFLKTIDMFSVNRLNVGAADSSAAARRQRRGGGNAAGAREPVRFFKKLSKPNCDFLKRNQNQIAVLKKEIKPKPRF
ncbi:hypothetical protein MmiEs2_04680 [Methanimicrococcus stummii]|uniref:Uncharacterized protein n=1 Tax=Methanimicrococcus stummii TaxID=3028294 RepID=A0AA96V7R0_9EURY|nr:hypothetical protein MmiEs2_04680 [Methanimicrococcus sp. Es2]